MAFGTTFKMLQTIRVYLYLLVYLFITKLIELPIPPRKIAWNGTVEGTGNKYTKNRNDVQISRRNINYRMHAAAIACAFIACIYPSPAGAYSGCVFLSITVCQRQSASKHTTY